jgi:hypothetical protein
VKALIAFLFAWLAVGFGLRTASAQEDPAPSAARPGSPVQVEIAPVALAQPTSYLPAMTELFVRIANNSKAPITGDVVATQREYGIDPRETRAPFSVAAGASVVLHVPVAARQSLSVAARTSRGDSLAEVQLTPIVERAVRVFDLAEVSRIKAAVDGITVTTDYSDDPSGTGSYAPPPSMKYPATAYSPAGAVSPWLRIATMKVDGATGTPILPAYVGGYSGVHLVVATTDVVTKLGATELEALTGFVLAGGTLALRVTRPEDLRNPTIVALVGGEAEGAAPTAELRASFPKPSEDLAEVALPGDSVRLLSYGGGNLAASPFGANAPYGLGEVVLLAFDPYDPGDMSDVWVRTRVVELARRAFERSRVAVASPTREPSMTYFYARRDPSDEVRKLLDPNQAARWGIAVATLLICGYAALAGPLVFSLARKKNRPLPALRILPVASFAAFSIIVLLGFVAKGVGVSAHHLTFVDAGAGMSKGSVRRFRGFFSPNAQTIEVRASDRTTSFKIPGPGGTALGSFEVDRDGQRLVGYEAMPSQTVLLREDGVASIGDGLSVTHGKGPSDLVLTNRTGKKLRALVVKLPDDTFRFAESLDDGASVESSALVPGNKELVAWGSSSHPRPAGHVQVHPLEGARLNGALREAKEKDVGQAWAAIDAVNGDAVDWFPTGLPVVLAAVDGGEGKATDSGVKVERDIMLVRVVGWGGAP